MDRDAAPFDEPIIGFNAFLGIRLVEWRQGFARIELALAAEHRNRSGLVHGGVIATLIDVACGYCGIWGAAPETRRRSVTLAMTTTFLGQARGERLSCAATQRGGGRSVFMASAEVTDGTGAVVAMGEGTYRYIDLARPR